MRNVLVYQWGVVRDLLACLFRILAVCVKANSLPDFVANLRERGWASVVTAEELFAYFLKPEDMAVSLQVRLIN